MTASDVADYYEKWKGEQVRTNARITEITIFPNVLEKMKNDPKYAESMMAKIKDAATPQGFENAQLYEYKVIVKDDGQIETLACADFMSGKNNTVSDDDDEKKKEAKKKLKQLHFNRYLFDNNKLESIIEEKLFKKLILN